MHGSDRSITNAEAVCLAVLLMWVLWIPLPFGSVVDSARVPLIVVPFTTCLAATLIRIYVTRERTNRSQPTRAWAIMANGGVLFLGLVALQLLPMPPSLLRALSPESFTIWSSARHVVELAGQQMGPNHPISIDPPATASELFRLAGILAAFTSAALLIRSHTRRAVLAGVLCLSALFQTFYGVREATLQRYEIWGWVNKLIFNRVTGTFVNPNHYAHYLAIVLPMALFLAAMVWRRTGASELPAARRLALLFERGIVPFSFAMLTAMACLGAMLLAQSRGALLALGAGVLAVASLLPGRRIARVAFGVAAGLLIVGAMVVFLGRERTVDRFAPNQFEVQTLVGRRIGISAALGLWNRFSLFGSGAGTFERVVALEQREDLKKTYHHAHNDYAEIAATTGTLGIVIALVSLAGGYVTLVRMTFGPASAELSWKRRAFQAAALCSLTVALVHALFDFNFFIPANAATLAVIAGAAVGSTDHDKRTRR